MPKFGALTAAQVKERFRARGLTITQWCKDNGYSRDDVYRVINGQLKANWGRAHEIAVKLGMKPSTSGDISNPQNAEAA